MFLDNDFILGDITLEQMVAELHKRLDPDARLSATSGSRRSSFDGFGPRTGAVGTLGMGTDWMEPLVPPGCVLLNRVQPGPALVDGHPPLFLFHDITGRIRHLANVTALLPCPCFGIECSDDVVGAAADVSSLGISYARLVLRAVHVVSESEQQTAGTLVRLGGYSYGCRIAYAAAHHLEQAGYQVELVLLDGSIDGSVDVPQDAVDRFAVEIYAHVNALQATMSVERTMAALRADDRSPL